MRFIVRTTFVSFLMLLCAGTTMAKKEDENYKKALVELEHSRYTSAINLLTAYLSNNDKAPLGYYYRSVAELESGEASMALGDINLALQLGKKLPKDSKVQSADLYYQKAMCLYALGNQDDAMKMLNSVIAQSSNYTKAYILKGQLVASKGNLIGADSLYMKALSIDPYNYDALVSYSKNMIGEKRYVDAVAKLTQVISYYKEKTEPYLLRYRANVELGNYERAFDDIAFVASNEDDYSPYLDDIGVVAISCRSYSVPYMSAKIVANENTTMWLLIRAAMYRMSGRLKDAIADYNDLEKRLGDKYALTLNGKGRCYYKMGDLESSFQMYSESLELEETAAAAAGLAKIYKARGNADKALEYASLAISLAPKSSRYYELRGQIYEMKSKNSDALTDYETGIKLNPKYSPLYLLRGKLRKSNKDFEKVIALEQHPHPVNNSKPQAYKMLGKKKEGKEWVMQMINTYPTSYNYYTAASFYASISDTTMAMTSLSQAFEKGFRDFSQIDTDKAWNTMRKKQSFVKLCNKWKRKSGVSISYTSRQAGSKEPTEVKEVKVVKSGELHLFPIQCGGVNMTAVIDTTLPMSVMSRGDVDFLYKYGYGKIKDEKFVLSLSIAGIKVDDIEFQIVDDRDTVLRLCTTTIARFGVCTINKQTQVLRLER